MLNLDSSFYADPAVFRAERERLFVRSWQLLGPEARLETPGSYLATEIAGHKVFVLRGRDGLLRGFRNVCRHRGARLLEEGEGACRMLRCPYHHWVYDDRGRLVTAPVFGEDPEFDSADWPLEALPLEIWRGLIFLAIDPVESLVEQLGDLVEELAGEPLERYRPVARERLVFDADWKIYTDNFVEGYHIPGIHPAFHAAIRFDQFETVALKGLVRMTAPPREGLFYRGKWLWMWPNWTLSLFQGGMNTSRINPVAHDRTELIYDFYFEDVSEASRAAREKTIADNLAVVREDFGVCVETHRNYETGAYRTGPLSPRHEQGVAYFQNRLKAVLEAGL